jgi:hypothetical protein
MLYYLLYGQHPLMPFNVKDKTFHSLDWPSVKTTEKLLALRILQISKRKDLLEDAVLANKRSQAKAAAAFNHKHGACMNTSEYKPGEWVIVYNEALDAQHGQKGSAKWYGPFIIVQCRPSDAYVIQQPDRVVLRRPIAWKWLKLYHFQENTEPVVSKLVWNYYEEDLAVCSTSQSTRRCRLKSWEIMDPEEQIQYWKSKYEATKRRALGYEPMMEVDNDLDPFIKEEQEFWDYSCSKLNQEGDQLHFPNGINFIPEIFNWLPWGTIPQCLREEIQLGKTLSGLVELNIAELEVLATFLGETNSSSAENELSVKIIMEVEKVIE